MVCEQQLVLSLLLLLSLSGSLQAQLQYGYYRYSCPSAEMIVKDEVRRGYMNDAGVAPGLVRLHFHDCFVRAGGFGYDVEGGRRDGSVSLTAEALANLPPFTGDVALLTKIFAGKGLSQEQLVILSGAHTIGRSHCSSVNSRLYSFSSSSGQDPSLDAQYATQLKQHCPKGNTDSNSVVPIDVSSPMSFDASYYSNILLNLALFTSDQTLISVPETAKLVNQYANNPFLWQQKFGDAMVAMGRISVLTGDEGEIRANCRVIN